MWLKKNCENLKILDTDLKIGMFIDFLILNNFFYINFFDKVNSLRWQRANFFRKISYKVDYN